MTLLKKLPIFAPFFLLLIFVVALVWWYSAVKPVSSDKTLKDFLIVKGTSAGQIGNNLQGEGFIKSSLAFKFYIQLTGKSARIQAGEYRLTPSFSLFGIVDQLLKGPTEIWITIPEGLRKEEIASKFAASLGKDEGFVEEFLNASAKDEGFLFPDTYLFPRSISAKAVVDKMTRTFDSKMIEFHSALLDKETAGGLDLKGIVTIASIIERETKGSDEKPVVAGILYKRLEADWPLQADATLQYAVANSKFKMQNSKLENWWSPLTKNDLLINSPYNTYKFRGLPPTPIASPGLSSIKAAIYPQESEYWFYLHDSQGKIYYSKTLEGHNENVRIYLGK